MNRHGDIHPEAYLGLGITLDYGFIESWRPCLGTDWLLHRLLAMVSTASHAQTWKINLRDADLTAFINEVADITGKNFAVDPRVRGNVTVISNKALNKNEVYDLFLGVLNVNGVVAIPSGQDH